MPITAEYDQEQKADPHGKKHVRFIVKYLDTLKENGLLEMAVLGQLPDDVVRSAKLFASHIVGIKRSETTDDYNLYSTPEQDAESNRIAQDYIQREHLNALKDRILRTELPATILPGQKHLVKSGHYYKGRAVLIKGLVTDIFGTKWDNMGGHPLAEKYLFRMQVDDYPWSGNVWLVRLLDVQQDLFLHETEIGQILQ